MSLGVAEMNSSDRDMVRAAQELRLIGPEQMIVPLTAEWCYSRQDPYAVTMSLNTGADEPVKWTFCRELLAAAHDDARLILARDPDLKSARGENLRTLLYLFGRDEAVRYLRTG